MLEELKDLGKDIYNQDQRVKALHKQIEVASQERASSQTRFVSKVNQFEEYIIKLDPNRVKISGNNGGAILNPGIEFDISVSNQIVNNSSIRA